VVSDSSFQAGRGAAAWIIKGRSNNNRIIGTCLSPSSEDGHSSFQSKLAGLYATLFTISHAYLPHTAKPMFRLACDGKSVIQRLQKLHITDPSKPHADLLSAARYLMTYCGVMVELQHVKGHQDSKCFGPFTRDATLNIKADQLARGKLDTYTPVTSNFHIPWSQGACYTGNRCIEKSFAMEI